MTSNRLPVLADEIRQAHSDVEKAATVAAERAIDAGRALIEAKALCGHGEWLPWLRKIGISERSAQRYLLLTRGGFKSATVADLGFARAERYASIGLKMMPADNCAVQAIGCDKASTARCLTYWWHETDQLAGYWHCTLLGAEEFYVEPKAPVPPWLLAAIHEGQSERFETYTETPVSVRQVRDFLADFNGQREVAP